MKLTLPQPTIGNSIVVGYVAAVTVLLGALASTAVLTIGGDGVPYLSIAQHYADGHWKEAVNAYWSPMLSWLLTPFVAVGIEGHVAYRILVVVAAVGVLIVGQWLIDRYTGGHWLGRVLFQASTLLLLWYAVQAIITPDLFVVLWVLLFVTILTRYVGRTDHSRVGLILLGAFGAVGYFVKAVLLPVFLVSIIVWLLFLDRSEGVTWRRRLDRLGYTALGLLVTALVWIVPLSLKYDHLTIGSAGKISMAYVGPQASGHPTINGLVPPPNAVAASPWEDPTAHPYSWWSPLDSAADFQFYIDRVWRLNIPEVILVLNSLSPFIVGALWLTIVLLAIGKVDARVRPVLLAAAMVSVLVMSAYAATQIIGGRRYLWPVFVLSNVSIAVLVSFWVASLKRNIPRSLWVIIPLFPLIIFANWQDLLAPPRRDTSYESIREASKKVSEVVPDRARFAANSLVASEHIAYFANLSGYGTTQPGLSLNDPLVRQALDRDKVEYYFYIDNESNPANLEGITPLLETEVEYGDRTTGLSFGAHKAWLIKLR